MKDCRRTPDMPAQNREEVDHTNQHNMAIDTELSQVGLKPTTLCTLDRCSTNGATETAQLTEMNQRDGRRINS